MDSRRRPSDTPSDNSARFLWRFNKASYAETDTSSIVSVDEAHQTEAGPTSPSPSCQHPPERAPPLSSPLSSPRSLDRPLPPLPPVRPPRPPSLNLNAIPSTSTPPSKTRQPRRAPQRRPAMPELHSDPLPRKLPVLDNVWEGFIREIEGRAEDILDFTVYGLAKDRPYTSQRGIEAVLDPPRAPPPRRTIYRTSASGSTPHLKSPHELHSDSDSEDESQENVGFSLSQFPAPPPMSRRRAPPKPLVLLPTPSIAPLPPSPSFSSGESTPVATPTTPRYVEPSPRKGILKNSSTSLSSFAEPASPTTPTSSSPRIKTLPKASPTTSQTPRPRLRSAQSVPYLQPPALANAHRTTSSDEPSTTHRRRVTSRPDPYAAQQFVRFRPPRGRSPFSPRFIQYSRAPLPPPPSNVQWGYAV